MPRAYNHHFVLSELLFSLRLSPPTLSSLLGLAISFLAPLCIWACEHQTGRHNVRVLALAAPPGLIPRYSGVASLQTRGTAFLALLLSSARVSAWLQPMLRVINRILLLRVPRRYPLPIAKPRLHAVSSRVAIPVYRRRLLNLATTPQVVGRRLPSYHLLGSHGVDLA